MQSNLIDISHRMDFPSRIEIHGPCAIAMRFNISDLVIGLVVVAFSTSTPELFVNVAASAKESILIFCLNNYAKCWSFSI
jgi:Ca2+/Na+ antiporter